MNASQLHRGALVCNLHDDWSIEIQRRVLQGTHGAMDATYRDRLIEGGINCTFYTVGGDDVMFTQDTDLLLGTLRAIDGALGEIERSTGFVICRCSQDVLDAQATGKIGLILTIEGVKPLGGDLSLLRLLYRLGLRSAILTWFTANQAADGVGEKRNGGLTSFGEELIHEMNTLGILIDISQSSPAAVADVLHHSVQPVIASHSNCSGQYPHRRNLTDEQLRRLAENGGVIGITCYPAHVGSGNVSVDDFIDHIDYAVNLIGIDHVAVGLNIVVHEANEAKAFYERSKIEYSEFHLPGLEDIDKMGIVTAKLLARGYAHDAIRKVLGDNVLRVVRTVMG